MQGNIIYLCNEFKIYFSHSKTCISIYYTYIGNDKNLNGSNINVTHVKFEILGITKGNVLKTI